MGAAAAAADNMVRLRVELGRLVVVGILLLCDAKYRHAEAIAIKVSLNRAMRSRPCLAHPPTHSTLLRQAVVFFHHHLEESRRHHA